MNTLEKKLTRTGNPAIRGLGKIETLALIPTTRRRQREQHIPTQAEAKSIIGGLNHVWMPFAASAREQADLRSRSRSLLQKSPQRGPVELGSSRLLEVQHGHQVAPAEQLTAHRPSLGQCNGEIHETQHPFIGQTATGVVAMPHQTARPVHLVGDHQDAL